MATIIETLQIEFETTMKRTAMKTASASLFIAVAAFAVTMTSVQAFGNPEFLIKAGLSDEQVIAVQEARELRKGGDIVAARDTLVAAGIDEGVIQELRQAHQQYKHKKHFIRAEADTLLTAEQRAALQVAHAANDRETVRAIFAEVGIELPQKSASRGR